MLPLSTKSIRAGFLYVTCSAGSMLCSHKPFNLPWFSKSERRRLRLQPQRLGRYSRNRCRHNTGQKALGPLLMTFLHGTPSREEHFFFHVSRMNPYGLGFGLEASTKHRTSPKEGLIPTSLSSFFLCLD